MHELEIGQSMYGLAQRLFPICRSLTGDGVRKTLGIIKASLPDLRMHEVASGTAAFDWTVPPEWNIADAYIVDPGGEKIIDFKKLNLHVVGYSEPVDVVLPLAELQKHLYSLPEQPDAVPYVTSYYQRRWGFCLPDRQRRNLQDGEYRAVIKSRLEPGHLTYADLIIPGDSEKEVFFSTYVCHPSMGNNEVSGPAVATALAQWVTQLAKRRFTYRFVFIPETIGSIVYLSRHMAELKERVIAGFNINCIGDERCYSYLPSRLGDTWSDRVALHVLAHQAPDFKRFTYLERGSDERQYCSPGVDLPIVSVMRSKFACYPEYHTSLDDLSFISPAGLAGGYMALRRCIETIEQDRTYRTTVLCEPQMGKRGLYSTLGTAKVDEAVRTRMNILAYCDGRHSVVHIADMLGRSAWDLVPYFAELSAHGLIESLETW